MRSRVPILIISLLAILAASCGSSAPAQTAADRAVGPDSPDWDVEQAILRTNIVEGALSDGLTRDQAACVIDTTIGSGDYELTDLERVDLSAQTSSNVPGDLADVLAESLIECGPSLRAYLNVDIPGSSSIPATHSVENDCLTNTYLEAWREAYTDRFRGVTNVDEPSEERFPEIASATTGMIAACEAGGAVILGASNEGHLDTHALSTLEWTCLDARINADAFMAALPFPDESGDAADRLGNSVKTDIAFCEAWVAGEDPEAEHPDAESGEPNS